MKMNKKSLLISIMVALIVFSTNSAAESCTQRPERAILERLLDLDVAGAETMLLSWPDGVNRQYYEAMVSVIKTYNGDNGVDEEMKKEAIKKLGKVIRTSQKNYNRKRPENSLVLGMSRMYRAGLNMTLDKGTSAYNDTYKSQQTFKELTKDYPDFTDSLLVMGMFELFLSNIPEHQKGKAKVFLSLDGNKQKGIDFLERAVETSPLTAPESARVLLMEANLEAPEICRYRSLAVDMRNRYRNNDLLKLTESIIGLQCNIAAAEGAYIAPDKQFTIHPGCL